MGSVTSEGKIAVPTRAGLGKWPAAAALVAILPAAAAAYGARCVIKNFEDLALTGSGGVGTVAQGHAESNLLMIAAALVAALLAGFLAFAVAGKPARAAAFPAVWFSLLVPVLAWVPALLLWLAESYSLNVAGNGPGAAGSIADAAQHLSNLLMGSVGAGIAVIAFAVGAFALSRTGTGRDARSCAMAWVGAAVLLLGLAALFYMRSSYLQEVAMRGSL
jgi:hypothetical protein